MRSWNLVLGYLLVCCALLSACSSGTTTLTGEHTSPAHADETAVDTAPEFTFNPGGLNDLPQPTHSVSITGPGWHEIPLATVLASAGVVTPHATDELPLVTTGKPAYALFGVSDFDGDCGPTSTRITMHSNTGEYYVGFSDYDNGTWLYSGPFTGMATVEIPNEGEYSYGTSFVSECRWSYLVVVVPDGSALNLSHVELGIDGGCDAPRAPDIQSVYASEDTVQLNWFPSLDAGAADFAGYIVERAPQYYGDFTELTPEPISGTCYLDSAVEEGLQYRYRLSSTDTSDNRGIGTTVIANPNPAVSNFPVALVDMPDGPLFGPVEIDFDMSASYDPEGDPITTYTLSLDGGIPSMSGPDPLKTLTMQPGCYNYVLVASTGTRSGNAYGSFKVYPRWRDTPVTVVGNPETDIRGVWISSGVHPVTGEMVHGYVETDSGQLRIVAVDSGGDAIYHSVEVPRGAYCLQAPIVYHDMLLFCIQSLTAVQIVAYDGTDARVINQSSSYAQGLPGLTSDGKRVWQVVCYYDGFDYHLQTESASMMGASHYAAENTGQINWIDAEYNQAVDAIDIVYTISASQAMYWVRDNLDEIPDTPVEIYPGATVSTLDMTVNPANGRPLVLYYDSTLGRHFFTALTSDLATWTTPEVVEDSMANQSVARLMLNDGYPTALIGLVDGSVNVYRRIAGWNQTNTFAGGSTILTMCSLVQEPGHSGVSATYRSATEGLVSYRADLDGTNTLIWREPQYGPLGEGLQGSAAQDGIHIVFNDPSGGAKHYSSPEGAIWVEETDIITTGNLDLVTSLEGEMYLSYYFSGEAYLDWWNGTTWVNMSIITTDASHHPIVNSLYGSPYVYFGCYNASTSQMVYTRCRQGEATSVTTMPTAPDVWAGQRLSSGRTVLWRTQSAPKHCIGYFGEWGGVYGLPVFYNTSPRLFTDNGFYTNRLMASGSYMTRRTYTENDVCWLASGPDHLPMRFEYYDYSIQNLTNLDLGAGPDADEYYTVSAMETPGYTTVGLIANTTGEYSRLEWSNFGDWEELPVPDCLEHMMSPEIVCGPDGRWHIIYRDWVNDDIMCLSTL